VPPVQPKYERLCDHARRALKVGIEAAKAGKPISDIGKAIEKVARKGGYAIIPELGGHGVGRHIHEKPSVRNYNAPQARQPLTEGLVITIEPFLNMGKGRIFTAPDKWTLKTVDGTMTAQYEHTLVIRGDDPVIVTAV